MENIITEVPGVTPSASIVHTDTSSPAGLQALRYRIGGPTSEEEE